MKILSFLLVFAMLLSFAACGADPAPADTSADSESDTAPADTTADTELSEKEQLAQKIAELSKSKAGFEVVSEDGTYKLVFSEASVVVQGEPEDVTWGHYQFPSLSRTAEGFIICGWSYSKDTIDYKSDAKAGQVTKKISVNGGKSWMLPTAMDAATPMNEDRLMANGKYFSGFGGAGARVVSYQNDYTPAYTFGNGSYKMFFWEDLKDDPSADAKTDTELYCSVYDPETKKTERLEVTLNWPYAPVTQHPGKMSYPLKQTFALCGLANRVIDGIPYVFLYTYGFNSFAESREEAVDEYCKYFSVYILNSPDYGTTWNLVSQVRTDAEIMKYSREGGLCEPMMTVAPDGTWVMLMRTGSNSPSFITYSKDKGVTWSKPEVFDDCGVLPQIMTLDCGVTLATYGRPYMYFRSTNDPSAIEWDDHIEVPLSATPNESNYSKVSCFNNRMMKLSEDTVMFAYTDFRFPNKDGARTKTVLTRTVKVVMLDE